MTEQETKDRQRRAYENRDGILPGDVLTAKCARIEDPYAIIDFGENALVLSQPEGSEIKAGDTIRLRCRAQTVRANGYGLYVDYQFTVEATGELCTISGPDAQSLVRTVKPVKIANRDIPLLREVLSVMQSVNRTEQLQEWQRERMVKITASLSGMPGGGGRKGLDDAVSILDELRESQVRACKEYAHALRRAQRVLNGIESRNMRAFVMLKYVMGVPDAEIRRELNLTRRGFDRAVRAIQDAPDMASVKWQERYILEDNTKY